MFLFPVYLKYFIIKKENMFTYIESYDNLKIIKINNNLVKQNTFVTLIFSL